MHPFIGPRRSAEECGGVRGSAGGCGGVRGEECGGVRGGAGGGGGGRAGRAGLNSIAPPNSKVLFDWNFQTSQKFEKHFSLFSQPILRLPGLDYQLFSTKYVATQVEPGLALAHVHEMNSSRWIACVPGGLGHETALKLTKLHTSESHGAQAKLSATSEYEEVASAHFSESLGTGSFSDYEEDESELELELELVEVGSLAASSGPGSTPGRAALPLAAGLALAPGPLAAAFPPRARPLGVALALPAATRLCSSRSSSRSDLTSHAKGASSMRQELSTSILGGGCVAAAKCLRCRSWSLAWEHQYKT